MTGQVMDSTEDPNQGSFVHWATIVIMVLLPVVLAGVKTLSVRFELVPTIVRLWSEFHGLTFRSYVLRGFCRIGSSEQRQQTCQPSQDATDQRGI